mgnify:CR=1 FL=1
MSRIVNGCKAKPPAIFRDKSTQLAIAVVENVNEIEELL